MAHSRLCSIPDCGKPHEAHGWCSVHYQRWKAHGDPLVCLVPKSPSGEPLRYFREVVLTYEGDECLIWPYSKHDFGYGLLWADGKMKAVHRLTCEEVNGPPPTPEHEAAHSCGKGHLACVTKRHLDWKTPAGNQADRVIHGTHSRGERHGSSKLTETDVREILLLKGVLSQRKIAGRFGVSRGLIYLIHRKKAWAWLTF